MDLSDYDQQYDGYVTVMTPDCLCELLDEIGVYHVHFILYYFILCFFDPMVNWWFGLVVWDSRGTPK